MSQYLFFFGVAIRPRFLHAVVRQATELAATVMHLAALDLSSSASGSVTIGNPDALEGAAQLLHVDEQALGMAYLVMANILMAYIVMTDIVMAYIVMADAVMAI